MDLVAISKKLVEKFGDAVSEPKGEAGDSYLDVAADKIVEVAGFLREEQELAFDFMKCLSGVDYPDKLVVVYHLHSMKHSANLTLKVWLDRESPVVASVNEIWRAAEWHERETYDLLGIRFIGHPDLRRILLPDDWQGYPLRKDYEQPAEYNGMSTGRPEFSGEEATVCQVDTPDGGVQFDLHREGK
jgi:NADH-quinone oxidoreductase subunit C